MRNLLRQDGEVDLHDFLARADMLCAVGTMVMISDYFEYYRLAQYLSSLTTCPIAISMGAGSLEQLFHEKYYKDLEGGILESFGRMFKNNTKLYVYPFKDPETGEITTGDQITVEDRLKHLYRFLVENGDITPLDNYRESYLDISSMDILGLIKKRGNHDWEEMVPSVVCDIIKKHHYFDYAD